jgi:hypothetical protein
LRSVQIRREIAAWAYLQAFFGSIDVSGFVAKFSFSRCKRPIPPVLLPRQHRLTIVFARIGLRYQLEDKDYNTVLA